MAKARAEHEQVRQAIKRGDLVRRPCEVCADPQVHAHHDDYSRPLDVRWLCPTHHRWLHPGARSTNPLRVIPQWEPDTSGGKMEERMYTVREAAVRIGAKEETIRRWLRDGKIKGVMPGGQKLGYRIPASEVERVLRGDDS